MEFALRTCNSHTTRIARSVRADHDILCAARMSEMPPIRAKRKQIDASLRKRANFPLHILHSSCDYCFDEDSRIMVRRKQLREMRIVFDFWHETRIMVLSPPRSQRSRGKHERGTRKKRRYDGSQEFCEGL